MSKAFDVTSLFAKTFPPAKMPTTITVTRFDLWAAKHQLYTHSNGAIIDPTETAAVNQARGILRDLINNTACGKPWRDAQNLPFHVYVNSHGVDYRMTDPETAHDHKTEQLPAAVGGKLNAQIKTLDKLEGAIDMTKLTEEDHIKFGAYKRARVKALRRVVADLDDLRDELEGIVQHQQRRKNNKQLKP
jgi:hypothetical protein